jgi:hypothetical protein
MGGVRTDHSGQSPTLKGLFAAGEAACWDMHGFNRLGGNSVAETVVAGMIVGEYIADFCDQSPNEVASHRPGARIHRARTGQARLAAAGRRHRRRLRAALAMQEIMTDKVGIFRTAKSWPRRWTNCRCCWCAAATSACATRRRGANPELATAYRVQKMLKVALCVAHGALVRTESRGAHFREDHPRRDDANWLKRTLATWPQADDTLPTLNYEPLDVKAMELPPGWRGYGAKDYIDHPDTPAARPRWRRCASAWPGRPPCGAAGADALRRPAATGPARPQRTHRRAAALMTTIIPIKPGPPACRRRRRPAASSPAASCRSGAALQPAPARAVAAALADLRARGAPGMTLFIALTEIREKQDPRCSSTSSAAPASAAAARCWSTAARRWPAAC